jgi:transposase-like protein
MYSYEDRIRAVKLYIKYDFSVADTIRELGYPTHKALIKWYKEYKEKGDLHVGYEKKPKFTRTDAKGCRLLSGTRALYQANCKGVGISLKNSTGAMD